MSSEFDLTTPYILTIGGTEPRKNTQILLDLFLKHDFYGCKLIVVGGEWNGKKFAREYQECQRIHLPGKVSEDQLLTLYKHAAVFVFPSLYEGFGLPPLEAMASGVPVIAAKASCLPEILGDAAVWFDPGKPEELLSAIHQILQNDTFRQEQVQKGYKKAKSYSWEKTVAETLGIYQSVLNGD